MKIATYRTQQGQKQVNEKLIFKTKLACNKQHSNIIKLHNRYTAFFLLLEQGLLTVVDFGPQGHVKISRDILGYPNCSGPLVGEEQEARVAAHHTAMHSTVSHHKESSGPKFQ